MAELILRVVEQIEGDLDSPADLVALEVDEDGNEVELDRKSFQSGHEASKYLANMVRNKRKG